mmetsp:Transcript_25044/g.34391  ORF Transcript_25044/g.34391 Transcript_25044/m.34391 type:complete len:309 (-) Transcript_25044:522-1448(-)
MDNHSHSTKVNKKSWTEDEDGLLLQLIENRGTDWKWSKISDLLNISRSGKQCRERYNNHLRPDIKKGDWSIEEDKLIIDMKELYGNQWTRIAKFLPGRSDNAVKNRWHLIYRYKLTDEESSESSGDPRRRKRLIEKYQLKQDTSSKINETIDENVVHAKHENKTDLDYNFHSHIEHDHDENIHLQHIMLHSFPFSNHISGYRRETIITTESNPNHFCSISKTENIKGKKRPLSTSTFPVQNRKVYYCLIPTQMSPYTGSFNAQCYKDMKFNLNDFVPVQLGNRNNDDSWIDTIFTNDEELKSKNIRSE